MRSDFLANDSSIAAQKHGHQGGVGASPCLSNLVHLAPVDGAILALVACSVNQFKLGVLLSCIAGVFSQLLDGIIQGPVEKHQARASIGLFGKIPAHNTPRNVEIDGLFSHGPHLGESDAICLEFRVCGPFQHLVSVCIARAPDSVMCKNLKLRTIEGTFGRYMMSWWRNRAVDRP